MKVKVKSVNPEQALGVLEVKSDDVNHHNN